MVLSLATRKTESSPCGDLHVITAALVVSSFFPFLFIFSKGGESRSREPRCPSWALKAQRPRSVQSALAACVCLPGFFVLRLAFRQENALRRKTPAWPCTAGPGWSSAAGVEPVPRSPSRQQTEQSPFGQAVAWAVLGTTGEPPMGAR